MRLRSKSLPLFLIALLAVSGLSLMIVKPANAQTIPTPTIPQFTMQLVNNTFNLAPTSTTNPFTGQQTTQNGVQLSWTALDLTIVNQPFNGQTVVGSNSYTGIMYEIHFKGHFSQTWGEISTLNNEGLAGPYFVQNSSGPNTVISICINTDPGEIVDTLANYSPNSIPNSYVAIPVGGQADFQVQALSGTAYDDLLIPFGEWIFNGTQSGWSNTQTITYNGADAVNVNIQPSTTSNPTQSPTPTATPTSTLPTTPTTTPSIPELSWLIPVPLLLFIFSVAVVVRHRKTANLTQ